MAMKVTFLLAHYPPDVAADGQLFSMLARALASEGYDVQVITFRPGYQGLDESAPAREVRDGVLIRRLWAPRSNKGGLLGRAFIAWWMAVRASLSALFSGGVLVTTSSPPTLGQIGWGLSWLGRRYIYVLHDLHPELAIKFGFLKEDSWAAKLLRFNNRRILKRAAAVVTLTEEMKRRALEIRPDVAVEVIPNWANTKAINPKPKHDSEFARANKLHDRFVLLYSGNMGVLHPVESLTRAMKGVDAELVFVGRGVRRADVEKLVESEGLSNIQFHDYQPLDSLADSLACCDLAVVCFDPAADGLAMPSKLQGIMAAGRPILAVAGAGSEVAKFVESHDVGFVVGDVNDAAAIQNAIESAMNDQVKLEQMGQRARLLAESKFSVANAKSEYVKLFQHE
ncbi:MAG: glycosyltransferase family 4 protein [Planctomycetota bacterium]|jgi:glycosyltransferase involved in cell wall biosynthesis